MRNQKKIRIVGYFSFPLFLYNSWIDSPEVVKKLRLIQKKNSFENVNPISSWNEITQTLKIMDKVNVENNISIESRIVPDIRLLDIRCRISAFPDIRSWFGTGEYSARYPDIWTHVNVNMLHTNKQPWKRKYSRNALNNLRP